MNDGKVKKLYYDRSIQTGSKLVVKTATEYEDYKVETILNYYCANYYDNGVYPECTSVKSDIILEDGSFKTIEVK